VVRKLDGFYRKIGSVRAYDELRDDRTHCLRFRRNDLQNMAPICLDKIIVAERATKEKLQKQNIGP
jgi:hypothetical protein